MKLTIIVDYKNESRMELARCLESIEMQTVPEIEIIMVGMNSDFMACAVDISSAVAAAKGEYRCVIPAYACLSPWFGEKMVAMCEEHGADTAVCGYMEIEKDTDIDQIGVPLMLYRSEKRPYDKAADKSFNKIQKRCGKSAGDTAYTAEPLVFISKSTERG